MEGRKEYIVEITKAAQQIILTKLNDNYAIDIKNNNQSDIVTEIDIEVEKFLVNKIKERYPNDGFITEENTVSDPNKDYVWIIDPIDGTMNFVYEQRDFAISIALYHEGIGEVGVVCNVVNDEMIVGVRNEGLSVNGIKPSPLTTVNLRQSIIDVSLRTMVTLNEKGIANLFKMSSSILSHRNIGSAAIRICDVALGRAHMYISDTLCIWDFAAGIIILREAGGYDNYMEEELKFTSDRVDLMVANNKGIVTELKDKFYFNN